MTSPDIWTFPPTFFFNQSLRTIFLSLGFECWNSQVDHISFFSKKNFFFSFVPQSNSTMRFSWIIETVRSFFEDSFTYAFSKCVFAVRFFIAFLHCVFGVRFWSAFFHNVFAMLFCIAFLQCVFAVHFCCVFLQCVFALRFWRPENAIHTKSHFTDKSPMLWHLFSP